MGSIVLTESHFKILHIICITVTETSLPNPNALLQFREKPATAYFWSTP